MSRPGKKIAIRSGVFTFSLKPENWSSHDHVSDFSRTGKKCTEIIKAREGRAKVLFCFIKYAKFVVLSLPSRRRSNYSELKIPPPKKTVSPYAECVTFSLPRIKFKLSSGVFE